MRFLGYADLRFYSLYLLSFGQEGGRAPGMALLAGRLAVADGKMEHVSINPWEFPGFFCLEKSENDVYYEYTFDVRNGGAA
jgi:hypothetical protein